MVEIAPHPEDAQTIVTDLSTDALRREVARLKSLLEADDDDSEGEESQETKMTQLNTKQERYKSWTEQFPDDFDGVSQSSFNKRHLHGDP